MGEVWLAEEHGPRNFRRVVAVKKLHSGREIGDTAMDSFVAEAQVIARLDHPNIVRLIELGGAEDGTLYLVLDFVDGCSLHKLIRNTGGLSPAAVAVIGRDMALALTAVHALHDDGGHTYGVVHRDVSPSNILVGLDGRVKLTDFGVARISGLGGDRTETGVFKGKLAYMPPEQANGAPFDGRADVFGLGMTLFEALMGSRVRSAETQAQFYGLVTHEPVVKVHQLLPDAPPALAAAIDDALAFDVNERTASAQAMANQLDDALWTLGPGADREAEAELAERVRTATGGSLSVSVPAVPHGPAAWQVAIAKPGAVSSSDSNQYHSQGASWAGQSHSSVSQAGTGAQPGAGSSNASIAAHSNPAIRSNGPPGSGTITNISTASEFQPPAAGQRRAWLMLPFAAVFGGVLALAFFLLNREPSESTPELSSETNRTESDRGVEPDVEVTPVQASAGIEAAAPPTATAALPEIEPTATSAPSTNTGGPPVGVAPKPPPPPTVETDPDPQSTEPGKLQVVAIPWGNVSVDGRSVGQTPFAPLSLPPGPHSVVVTNPDLGATRSYSVNIKPGQAFFLKADLKSVQ